MQPDTKGQIFIGLMSGTSLDGIDAIVIDLSAQPRILACHYQPYDDDLRQQLRHLSQGCPDELTLYAQLDNRLGKDFADAANAVRGKASLSALQITAIGSHGHTVRHTPSGDHPNSLQIGDPNLIAALTGITTISDFRRRDIAVGGQGAPLVPAFHHALFRHDNSDRIIVNIGGIANITLLPADGEIPVTGWDTGPGNTLMNAWIYKHSKETHDQDGQWAAQGARNESLLKAMIKDPYFHKLPPKSTGPEYFNLVWLEEYLSQYPDSPANIQSSLCELTTTTIANAIRAAQVATTEVFICGGGCHNPLIMQQLQRKLANVQVTTTQTLGIDPDWVEAAAFAWLAQQTIMGKTANLPAVTGASHAVILGGVYSTYAPDTL